MTKFRILLPAMLVLTFACLPAHASFFEWLFGGRQTNYRSFKACAHAVYKRDNNRGELDREYIAKECGRFVRDAEDECELARLLDVKGGHLYTCTAQELAQPNSNYFDICWDKIFCD